jgi:hypothetical protein
VVRAKITNGQKIEKEAKRSRSPRVMAKREAIDPNSYATSFRGGLRCASITPLYRLEGAKRGKVQTQEDTIFALLKGKLEAEPSESLDTHKS